MLLGLLLSTCRPDSPKNYIFLGHPYDYHRLERLDPRVERLLIYPFDQVWLGGDVCAQTASTEENLHYLDSVFQAIPGELHWALGNHDVNYGPIDRVLAIRNRGAFYASYREGICLLVLDTNLFWLYPSSPPQEQCSQKEAQLALIRSVADTIRKSSHLVVLHHHGLFTEMLTDSVGQLYNPFNVNAMVIRATCDSASFVNEVIYPALVEVQKRGIQVICIGGDVGMVAKSFVQRTPEGIIVLGSGINNSQPRESAPAYVTNFDPDKVLWLEHWPAERRLQWRFLDLDSLIVHIGD